MRRSGAAHRIAHVQAQQPVDHVADGLLVPQQLTHQLAQGGHVLTRGQQHTLRAGKRQHPLGGTGLVQRLSADLVLTR
jgi:hypothetical protein